MAKRGQPGGPVAASEDHLCRRPALRPRRLRLIADLTDLRDRIRTRGEDAVARAAPRLQSLLRDTSPVDEGELRDNTRVAAQRLQASVVVDVDYASFVRAGTEPHVIVPRTASVLRFRWPAGPVELMSRDGFYYFRRVQHPGTRANDWYDNGLREWPRLLEEGLG